MFIRIALLAFLFTSLTSCTSDPFVGTWTKGSEIKQVFNIKTDGASYIVTYKLILAEDDPLRDDLINDVPELFTGIEYRGTIVSDGVMEIREVTGSFPTDLGDSASILEINEEGTELRNGVDIFIKQ